MRVLLDECVPRRLGRELPGHEVYTVAEMGWSGCKDGDLLVKAASSFDVLLAVDQNLQYQQNLAALPLAVIVLISFSNDINQLRPMMPQVLKMLPVLQSGMLHKIGRL